MEKVICIDASNRSSVEVFPNWVEEGETYTVRSIENGMYGRKRVLLEEVKNPKAEFPELMGYAEPGFNLKRFVPIEDSTLEESEKVSEVVEEVI